MHLSCIEQWPSQIHFDKYNESCLVLPEKLRPAQLDSTKLINWIAPLVHPIPNLHCKMVSFRVFVIRSCTKSIFKIVDFNFIQTKTFCEFTHRIDFLEYHLLSGEICLNHSIRREAEDEVAIIEKWAKQRSPPPLSSYISRCLKTW